MKASRIFLIFALVLIIAAAGGTALAAYWAARPVDGADASKVRVTVAQGASARQIAHELFEKGLIRSEKVFYLFARFNLFPSGSEFKAGTYEFSPSMTMLEAAQVMADGRQSYTSVSFPEGLTISKMARILEESGVCSAEAFSEAARSKTLLEKYKIPADDLEGYLFPDTYFFTEGMEGAEVAEAMLGNFFSKIKSAGIDGSDPRKLHRLVILSSIIEREYRVKDEAPLIASVFANRIRDGIGLYSCATIEYIITEKMGLPHPDIITYDDLKIDSAYNTYKYNGLPAGPISNPGLVALSAAANPPETEYFFFRLKDSEEGTHTFSKTFSSHIDAGNLRTKKPAGR